MKRTASLFANCFLCIAASAQYAPQAGIAGSDAVPHNSAQIIAWATGCTIQRGRMDIAQPSLGYANSGDSTLATGAADNMVVSLGDSGVATLTFAQPIMNGAGADFVVFENGFLNTANNEEAFLELAFVEVSSDGLNFFRFPSSSLTQDTQQIAGTGAPGTGDYINARHINNLAGKYISKYGTPFDLEELKDIAGLDVNNITHIRLVDVIGSLGTYASKDKDQNIINDPYPTPFPTCGFDLDAVGVIHQQTASSTKDIYKSLTSLAPNPTTGIVHIQTKNKLQLIVTDISGKILLKNLCNHHAEISLGEFQNGIYFFNFTDVNGNRWSEKVIKY